MRALKVAPAALCLLVASSASVCRGAEPPADKAAAAPAEPAKSTLPSWIQIGGQMRGRFEAPAGQRYGDYSDDYFLTRLRANVMIKPVAWLKAFAQTQDSRAFGYNSPIPGSTKNTLDLRQAYVELSGEGKQSPMVRVGRQEMVFGTGRLIGLSDWGNWGMMVDGARAAVSSRIARLDVFSFAPVVADDSRFDQHKPGLHYHGAYVTLGTIIPYASVEPYYILKRQMKMTGEHGELGNLTLSTVGGRIGGKLPGRLDYTAELAKQFGRSARDRVSAVAGSYILGWTVSAATWKPRVSMEFTHASGDQSDRDGYRGTFDQLQGAFHWQQGIADQVGWRNMRDVRAGFDVVLLKKLKLQTDWNEFYLASTQDGLYNASGTRTVFNRKATSRHVGHELDVFGSYQFTKSLVYGVGVAHLWAGAYLKQSTAGHNYWYPYVFCTRTF